MALGPVLMVQLGPGLGSMMADHLPPVLLEACVVVGASSDKLREVYQVFASKRALILPSMLLDCHSTKEPNNKRFDIFIP